ncbi:hypothetical protein [Bacteroides propionicifaciens]|uniref:hypothetical protein n=1 Tax=Bacteroides propionicifaciens TaxID=392838 RepID=UPI00036C7CF3|nr:hypothetical protein [Bacteroides propionicifaciens]
MAAVKHDSNTDIFRGQLFVFINDKPIAYGKDASMNVSTEEIDVSNKMVEGDWKTSLPGKKSFGITSESLLTQKEDQESFPSLLNKQIKGETLPFVFGQAKVTNPTATGGEFELDKTKPHWTGTIMITSLDVKSTDGDIATCSASFAGVGALKEGTVTAEPSGS